MGLPVIPLMRTRLSLIREFVARRLPGFAAILGALHYLSVPAARLRQIQPLWIDRRPLDVINLPARKMRAANIPLLALSVRCQNECAFARSDQYPCLTHL